MTQHKLISLAIEEAFKSTHQHKIGAIIYTNKGIISKGHNDANTWRHNLHPKYKRWPTSIHAEVAAILSAKKDLKGCFIIVIRVNKMGELRMAKPCNLCMNYIDYVGIKKVSYSTNNGMETITL
jgi:deoxycytidylate deaminase